MTVKHSIKCITCPNIVDLNTDPESLTLYLEGKLPIQQCFTELTPGEREMLISGYCPECWDSMFAHLDEDIDTWEENVTDFEDPTPRTGLLRPRVSLKRIVKQIRSMKCWRYNHGVWRQNDWNDPHPYSTGIRAGAWVEFRFKDTISYDETQLYFGMFRWKEREVTVYSKEGIPVGTQKEYDDKVKFIWNPFRWFWWHSEHVAIWFGQEVEAPHGTCYEYRGILGYHLDC